MVRVPHEKSAAAMVAMQQELEALRSQLAGAKQEMIVKEKAAADFAQMHSTMKSEAAEAAAAMMAPQQRAGQRAAEISWAGVIVSSVLLSHSRPLLDWLPRKMRVPGPSSAFVLSLISMP